MANNKINNISDEMIDQMLGNAKAQEDLFGKDGIIKQIFKRFMDKLLETEMTLHIGYTKPSVEGRNSGNSRNGKVCLAPTRIPCYRLVFYF